GERLLDPSVAPAAGIGVRVWQRAELKRERARQLALAPVAGGVHTVDGQMVAAGAHDRICGVVVNDAVAGRLLTSTARRLARRHGVGEASFEVVCARAPWKPARGTRGEVMHRGLQYHHVV